ncbi:mycofactocin-coupled SDR family oxidoreductase [Amycolatopsis acidiphila]|uniref:SDR family oxidoreductase n=1 Tax=Amycolatopsis acidiphila TaxID=715473 RepID=A0A558A7G0_9PSEU|nr:mycofactocin-coupled SDR family oxidoreductase [Amycolatopsis acidiphila]TVT20190.1 SDR family oxidoreductase [Amycolatopsis acidiphila]UIJ58266.1 mycofactocin-coupled SDR family oxidoreductase [Amycolatopsis acidiphila]GHG69104.1 3-hydroxyacyl-CoA dehydrogenase [Amycolatopsis acidiphila]
MSRVALVTGAARGIGAAVVDQLAGEGWQVVAVDLCADLPGLCYPLGSKEELSALANRWPGRVLGVVGDVREQEALTEAVARAESEFGGLDAVVAAAAVMAGGKPLWETTNAEWDALFDIGVRGVFNLARAAVPALLRRPEPRSGRFVALASAAGHKGLWHLAGYNAAKHSVVGLIRGLATDLRGTGVTATAVSPGSTRTAMLDATADLYGLGDVEEFSQHQLAERLLEPEEVAAAVCWLCGEQSSAITGTVVHADGGFTA